MSDENTGLILANITQAIAALNESIAGLRADMVESIGGLRTEMAESIGGLRTEMAESIAALKVEMFQRMDENSATLEESIRDSQTEVLRVMITAQEGNVARFTDMEHTDNSMKERIAIVERRLWEIEKKLLMAG